jgi:hypothetical protein
MLDLAASPDLGLIWISVSSGIAIVMPVGINADSCGLIFIGLSVNAIKSIPEDPSVLYFGSWTFELSFLIKTLTIKLV